MAKQGSNFFLHVRTDPDPRSNPTLWEHRLKKGRPLSCTPFKLNEESRTDYGLSVIDSPAAIQDQVFNLVQDQPSDKVSETSKEESTTQKSKNRDLEWGEQVPSWLNLFYDLAWTATFASLTFNNKFKEPWDSVSYVVFFVAAWWLWALQDITFLLMFGALAATTKGFDVRNYITQSPGEQEIEPYDIMKISPERYKDERLTEISLRVIIILLLIQHLRVLIYAKISSRSSRIPYKLLIIPTSLVISAGLFFGAFAITLSSSGTRPHGAKIKFVLGGVALLVEMAAHIKRLHMDIGHGLRLRSHGSMAGRLNEITAIILGECINAIAQTFYAIEQAPGFRKTTAVSIICCAVIVFFLAYLYFEGAAPLKSVRRRAAWLMIHLPWLLSVILLLEGVKNQLLLSNFLGSGNHILKSLNDVGVHIERAGYNETMAPLLLQFGLTLDGFLNDVDAAIAQIPENLTSKELEKELQYIDTAMILKLQLSGVWNTYNTFMNNETIPKDTYKKIQNYLHNDSFIAPDVEYILYTAPEGNDVPIFFDILEELMKPSFVNARYIMGLCGLTFVFLATMNLIQAWPRDRFHWASIFSRYAMGGCMFALGALNFGTYQHYMLRYDRGESASQWAGVYRWTDASWVLPTIAIAYALQFFVDTGITYAAIWYGKRHSQKEAVQATPENKV